MFSKLKRLFQVDPQITLVKFDNFHGCHRRDGEDLVSFLDRAEAEANTYFGYHR